MHSIKSSARIIGAEELGEKAQDLENAGKDRDDAFIKEHHALFLEDYMKLKLPLSNVFKEETAEEENRPETTGDYLLDIYTEIRRAAEGYDTERLDALFGMMEEYSIPEDEKTRWYEIRAAYEQFDYPLILSLLDSMI